MRQCTAFPAAWVVTSLALLAQPAAAGLNVWTPIGPETATITALAVRPDIPRILYAGTRGQGLLKSINRGASWTRLDSGFPERPEVGAIAIAPSAPVTLYALANGTELARSDDGGTRWQILPSLLPLGGVESLAVDAGHVETLYAAGIQGAFKSLDGGLSWAPMSRGLPAGRPSRLLVDPRRPQTLYLLYSELGLFKSTNGGARWFAASNGLPPLSASRRATALALDPGSPQNLTLALSPRQLFRSTDGGGRWRAVHSAPVPGQIQHLAVLPGTPTVLLAVTPRAVERSIDGGATFAIVGLEMPRDPILAVAANPQAGGTAYLGFALAGVYRSQDTGRSFEAVNRGMPRPPTRSLVAEPGVEGSLVAGIAGITLGEAELFRRRGPDQPWLPASGGLVRNELVAFASAAFDPKEAGILYAGLFLGVARTSNDGRGWTVGGSTGCTIPQTLVVASTTPTTLYLGGPFVTTICNFLPNPCDTYRSVDAGASWACLRDGLGDAFVALSFAVDPVTPTTVYAGARGVSRSLDSGLSWEVVGAGLTGGDARALAIDPGDPDRLYAGTEAGVFRSQDAALSWQPAGAGLPAGAIDGLVIDGDEPATLYATVRGHGVYASDNRGVSWSPLDEGLEPSSAYGPPVLDGARSRVLYVQTTSGVWSYERTP